jgi:hypothetical protein
MNTDQIQSQIDNLPNDTRLELLICYGHELTVMSREAYEFQSPEVKSPKLLRDANEIHHRIYQAIRELIGGNLEGFSASGISHWIAAVEKSEQTKNTSAQAFERALTKCNI